jgi:GH35 family endo-1,4-beta-xylanase
MKRLKKRLFLALPVFAGILVTCMSSTGSKDADADNDIDKFFAPPATMAVRGTYQGKENVTHVRPDPAYDWAVLIYGLNDYAGKEITVTLSMDVWLTASTKVAWQAQLGSSYPVIAGSTSTDQIAGQWVPVTGGATITVPSDGGELFLSSQQLGTGNEVYIANFVMTIDDGSGGENESGEGTQGSTGAGKTLKMTVGAKENLTGRITAFNPAGRTLTWTSSASGVAAVNRNGLVTAAGFTSGGSSTDTARATGTATIRVTASGPAPNKDTFTINTTMESQIDILNLPPLKDRFANHFLIGNITRFDGDYSADTNPAVTNTRLLRHFNVLTPENVLKPSYYGGSRSGSTVSGLTFTQSDNFVNAAHNSGFKTHGHVLLWHSQNSAWIRAIAGETDKTAALEAMKSYLTQVVSRYKGKIYSWDILNEAFPDGVNAGADWTMSMRKTGDFQAPNPWYVAIGSDFVYEGFLAARQADPNAILYYNDYNLNQAGKATMVRNMVRDVNARYEREHPSANRKLIEGIGMQSHHNADVTVSAIKASLDMFRQLGVKISISEIDILCMGYGAFEGSTRHGPNKAVNSIATNDQKLQTANLYGRFFSLFIENADIIERVSFWGLFDNASWRSGGLPLPFEGSPANSLNPDSVRAKPAYYKIIGVL